MLAHHVPEQVLPMRVDRYLERLLPQTPGWLLRQTLKARDVKCNGRRIVAEDLVQGGDFLQIYLPEQEIARRITVVYEDAQVLIVDKPQGISVTSESGEETLEMQVQRYLAPKGETAQACHRLDHQTGGLVFFAKTPEAHALALDAFARRTLEKHYTCVVRGRPKQQQAVCYAWLRKDAQTSHVQILDHDAPDAQRICTRFTVLEAGEVSRLDVELVTGRTHQIRAHLASLGHPIVGDDKYGDRSFNRRHGAKRQMLWATRVTLHFDGALAYLEGKTVTVDAPF